VNWLATTLPETLADLADDYQEATSNTVRFGPDD